MHVCKLNASARERELKSIKKRGGGLLMAGVFAAALSGTPLSMASESPAAPVVSLVDTAARPSLSWSPILLDDGLVPYRGVVNFDTAGMGAGPMMYPAPGVAGLLVAVLTHGVMVESAKNSQKTKMQEDADRVVSDYPSVLGEFKLKELAQQALGRVKTAGGQPLASAVDHLKDGWRVVLKPVFSMTQDQKGLLLDHAVEAYPPGAGEPTKVSVRVVSRPVVAEQPGEWWRANGGAHLKDESAMLMAESLDIVLAGAGGAHASVDSLPQQTVRYLEGGVKKTERAHLLAQNCNRRLFKTLRGDFLSVPAPQDAEPCLPQSVANQ